MLPDTRPVALITGGNSGIGRETATRLAERGAEVVITSRDAERGRAAVEQIRSETGIEVMAMSLDLASVDSIRSFSAEFCARFDRLDVLVNNAGLILSERTETEDGLEATFAINHLGHFLLTQLLEDRLLAAAPSRVINLASDAHRGAPEGLDFDDLQSTRNYRGFKAYARSKLANILFTRELARRLEGRVHVHAVHPGLVRSGFADDGDTRGASRFVMALVRPFGRSVARGADTVVWLATDPSALDSTGGYWVDRKPRKPNAAARDDHAARRLWDVSEALVMGLEPQDA
jgi:NAD(P)-dependent dehydrogenase (short-subunit alcohol dehydrogenase family)